MNAGTLEKPFKTLRSDRLAKIKVSFSYKRKPTGNHKVPLRFLFLFSFSQYIVKVG